MTITANDKVIVVTDLDGTLLDHFDYSFTPAKQLLGQLELAGIPVIINTSKTRAELLELRKALNNRHPFIVENGSAIFVPDNYWKESNWDGTVKDSDNFQTIKLGIRREIILDWVEKQKDEFHNEFSHFDNLTVEEIVELTGLSTHDAKLAATREFSEPIKWLGKPERLDQFIQAAKSAGFKILKGGRFIHLLGQTNKGAAMKRLLTEYAHRSPAYQSEIVTIACGDGNNDIAMLEAADYAVIVRSPAHQPPTINSQNDQLTLLLTKENGPEGWAKSVSSLLREHLSPAP